MLYETFLALLTLAAVTVHVVTTLEARRQWRAGRGDPVARVWAWDNLRMEVALLFAQGLFCTMSWWRVIDYDPHTFRAWATYEVFHLLRVIAGQVVAAAVVLRMRDFRRLRGEMKP